MDIDSGLKFAGSQRSGSSYELADRRQQVSWKKKGDNGSYQKDTDANKIECLKLLFHEGDVKRIGQAFSFSKPQPADCFAIDCDFLQCVILGRMSTACNMMFLNIKKR